MFDTSMQSLAPGVPRDDRQSVLPPSPAGGDRGARELEWLRAGLDSIDYPIVGVAPDRTVLLVNRAARLELADPGHPLHLNGGMLRLRESGDVLTLQRAMRDALRLGLRRMVMLGGREESLAVAVRPLDDGAMTGAAIGGVLLVFGKRRMCETLSVDWFARDRGLTGAETRVFHGLSDGLRASEIAARQGVALSTVRSQVRSLCAKAGTSSVRELLRQVAALPPMPGVSCTRVA